jgi:hypothetical protein
MTHAILPFLIATILAAGTAGAEVRTIGGAASPCLTDSVGRALATSRIEVLVLRRDSTQLAMNGLLPADTADVSIVTDSTTCEAGLAAYNAHASQSPRFGERGLRGTERPHALRRSESRQRGG